VERQVTSLIWGKNGGSKEGPLQLTFSESSHLRFVSFRLSLFSRGKETLAVAQRKHFQYFAEIEQRERVREKGEGNFLTAFQVLELALKVSKEEEDDS